PYIKMAIDSGRKKGEFWLTGSQQFHLMAGVTESLAGRVAILQLLGFSSRELDGHAGLITPFDPANLRPTAGMPLLSLYERIWRGSFPAVAVDDTISRNIFYSSYVQTYIQRDVRALTNIGDELAFMKFLRAVAARTGQMLNMADLARDVSISPNTAKSWLSILKTSGLVYLLEPYHSNLSKRLTKTPKLYFLDTGLAAYLTEWSSARVLEAGAMSGAIFETWVVTELIKSYWHCGRQAPIYYYRDKDNNEIDILINCDGTLFPIEIKKTATPGKNDIRHFAALDHFNLPVGPGTVICMTDKTFPISATCQAIPACGV
ncbi:MAG: DUF4143 domain-containing protein, partial [Sedimentisphaerales bacterium]|nr:DUF4143 domain-containing protein [Sedimentisphaerales bacterium]